MVAALLGKLTPYVLTYWLWCVFFTAWIAGWRGWPVAGSLTMLLLAQLAFCAAVGAISACLVGLLRGVDEALSISALYLGSDLSTTVAVLSLGHLARRARLPDKSLRSWPTPRGYWRSLMHTLGMVAVNRPILLTVVFAVVLYGFYYPTAYEMQTVIKIPVAVVDLDRSPLSRSFLRQLNSTR